MPEIRWLPEALADAERLLGFIKDKSPSAAAQAARTIQKGARLLANFPEMGRPMFDNSGRRELFLSFGAGGYVLRYLLDGNAVVILRVWHSKEQRE